MTIHRISTFCLATGILISAASDCLAQQGRGGSATPAAARRPAALEDAADVLKKAVSESDSESRRQALENARDDGRVRRLVQTAREESDRLPDAKEKELIEASRAKMGAALRQVAPEGRALLAQNAGGRTRAPEGGEIVPDTKIVIAEVADAKPQPLKPVPLNPPADKTPQRTVITSDSCFIDSKQALAVYVDDVTVNHPQFHLSSAVLEVYMLKDSEKAELATKTAATPAKRGLPGDPEPYEPDENIKQAIAKGPRVVIQKLTEDGDIQVGICKHATYVGATGDMILRDYPQVQRGQSLIVASAASTVMTLKQNGALDVKGPAQTQIIQDNGKKKRGTVNAPATVPGLAPAPTLTPRGQGQ